MYFYLPTVAGVRVFTLTIHKIFRDRDQGLIAM